MAFWPFANLPKWPFISTLLCKLCTASNSKLWSWNFACSLDSRGRVLGHVRPTSRPPLGGSQLICALSGVKYIRNQKIFEIVTEVKSETWHVASTYWRAGYRLYWIDLRDLWGCWRSLNFRALKLIEWSSFKWSKYKHPQQLQNSWPRQPPRSFEVLRDRYLKNVDMTLLTNLNAHGDVMTSKIYESEV